MRREQNHRTQPFWARPVFQNWDVIAKAWYVAFPSRELPVGRVKALDIGSQHLVFFRGQDGRVRAVDGFCPHMGTDLAIGKVVGDRLRCFFHHWQFDGEGACRQVPCNEPIPRSARLRAYAVEERYGFVWVYPDRKAPAPVARFEAFSEDEELICIPGRPYERTCHHHVTMINGIDPQHLKTVHDLSIELDLEIASGPGDILDYRLKGEIPAHTPLGRLGRRLLGPTYGYSMRYQAGSIGLLTINRHTRLFGTGRPLPELYMIFAYRPMSRGRTFVQPIYVTRKRRGLIGGLKSQALIAATRAAFHALQGEDGRVYENMRFNPTAFLKADEPVAAFLDAIDRLVPSVWSAQATGRAGATRAPEGPPNEREPEWHC